jgi:PAS domain S-box-containing protein
VEPLSILYIEDEPLDSELIRAILQREGLPAEIERVADMAAFQAALATGKSALILSDYTLPGMDALEALRWARQHRPEVPFIFVSGTLGEEAAIETLKLGATDYVLKQRLERLGPAVQRALQETAERTRHRQAEAELRAHEESEIIKRKEAEGALRDADLRLRLALEATSLGIFDYYPQTGQIIWSERVKRHFGLSPEAEVTYDLFLRGVHPEDRERAHHLVQQALQPEQGGRLRAEYRTLGLEDGQERWLEVFGQTYFDAQGRPLRLVGATRDITQRKQDDATLRQSEERHRLAAEELQAIMDATPAGILVAHDPECHVITGNGPAHEVLGVPLGVNITATPPGQKHSPYFRILLHGREAQGAELPMQLAGATGTVVRDQELEVVRRDGTRRTMLVTATPLHAADGRIRGAVGTLVDITRRKQAEEALRQSEEKFRAVFEQAAIGIGRVRFADARWIDVNEAFCRILGYSAEELRATSWPQITHPEDVELDLIPFRRMARGEIDSYHVEKRFIHKAGHPVWARLTLSLVRDAQGQPDYEIAIIENIIQRKQAEAALKQAQEELAQANADLERRVRERTAQLQATLAELEQMSYSMVHDLRAPLRAIQSFGGIVAEDPDSRLTQESREMIGKMRSAADRMDHLVRDVLNYSQVVRKELPLQPVDVGELARGIVETYPNLHRGDAQVQIASAFLLVLGNPAALTQCLSQLLGNAVKFTPRGQPPKIQVWSESGAQGWVRIVVADQGIGIEPHLQERVFGMFQQLRNTAEGTGMGLAIVKKAVERMGGRVGVDSEPGVGSRFWFELKAAEQLA